MAWDDDLTPEQREATSHIGMHARLLAGPGTGKTRCLTRRVLYLIEVANAEPSKILVLTFTRAARAELSGRVGSALGENSHVPHISTLHSFALTTILNNQGRFRLPSPVRIADDYEERSIIHEELKSLLGLARVGEAADLFDLLSADWEQLAVDWEGRFPNPRFIGAWREHRQVYGYTLRSELVYQLKQGLTEDDVNIDVPPKYLLVDEYQDLNACDLAVIGALVGDGAELYAAGDDDQSIYGFRYANPEGIRRFVEDYKPSKPLDLQECMRCDRKILDLGLYIARQDPRRLEKSIRPKDKAAEGAVHLLRFADQDREAEGIARICQWLVEKQHVAAEGILVVLRSDRHSRFSEPIRQALKKHHLQTVVVADPLEPLNCPVEENGKSQVEGRQLLCLLRLMVNRQDHLAWRTLLDIRGNGIGSKALQALYELARKAGTPYSVVLQRVKTDPALLPVFGRRVKSEVEAIEAAVSAETLEARGDLAAFIRGAILRHIADPETQKAVTNVFERVMEVAEGRTLEDLLRALNVSLTDKEQETQKGAINIMTMHQAKGLTADAVFVAAAEDEYIPGRATGEREGDERRLLYVSVTRGRHYLFLTRCKKRTGPQRHTGRESGKTKRRLSRYLSGGPAVEEDGATYVRGLE
jgi:DNA helicase II / ATP-dependent DNA helicase PcrA